MDWIQLLQDRASGELLCKQQWILGSILEEKYLQPVYANRLRNFPLHRLSEERNGVEVVGYTSVVRTECWGIDSWNFFQ
jgi:hypothetical protein